MPFKCWADCLGDCGGGPSREHIISKNQFEGDSITLQGLPWCMDAKTVGINALVCKNLCVDHNGRLGETVDKEALMFRLSVREIHRAIMLPVRVKLDARLIERWLLKTIINITAQSDGSGLEITPELVRRAFGLAPTPRSEGFFGIVEEGEQLHNRDGNLRFEFITHRESGRIAIGGVGFHGWRALYAFHGAPPVRGAMRVRRWNGGVHWLQLRWNPDLEPGDTTMPELTDEQRAAG